MALFTLKVSGTDVANAELFEATKTSLDLEKHLEGWLEKSPWAIALEPLLVISRQASAGVDEGTVFPDLIALDKDGNVVIVELKRGKAPREVTTQLLEYAAWASDLSDEDIVSLAASYFGSSDIPPQDSLAQRFCTYFERDELPSLNHRLRLYIAAEEIPHSVARVCRFLRTAHGVDVNCVKFSVFQTKAGEILVISDRIVGQEDVASPKTSSSERWSGEMPVKQVVWEAVCGLTRGDKGYVFSPKDVAEVVLARFPNFNKSTINCQIIADSVNHNSRHHYPGGDDRYWWLGKGKYRLFDSEHDIAVAIGTDTTV